MPYTIPRFGFAHRRGMMALRSLPENYPLSRDEWLCALDKGFEWFALLVAGEWRPCRSAGEHARRCAPGVVKVPVARVDKETVELHGQATAWRSGQATAPRAGHARRGRRGQETLQLAGQETCELRGQAPPDWPCRHLRALPGGVLVPWDYGTIS